MAYHALHHSLFARLFNQARKIKTRLLNWIYLVTQTGKLGYTHVSTKHEKSVFQDGRNYYYVYRRTNLSAFANGADPTRLLPLSSIKQRIFIYPAGQVATAAGIDAGQVFELIDQYSDIGRIKIRTLAELLDGCFSQKIAWQEIFKRIILENYDASTLVQVGLCHCDLTQRNIVFYEGHARIIDWDDSRDYIHEYDKIYYCFMAMMTRLGRVGYTDSFQSLGLEGRIFNADLAMSQLNKSCQGRFSDLSYLLFLMMFVMKAGEISPIASHLWSRVVGVTYKGRRYVC
jgi:hypothetical protein